MKQNCLSTAVYSISIILKIIIPAANKTSILTWTVLQNHTLPHTCQLRASQARQSGSLRRMPQSLSTCGVGRKSGMCVPSQPQMRGPPRTRSVTEMWGSVLLRQKLIFLFLFLFFLKYQDWNLLTNKRLFYPWFLIKIHLWSYENLVSSLYSLHNYYILINI